MIPDEYIFFKMMQLFFLFSSGEHVNEILILGTESGLDGLMKYKD